MTELENQEPNEKSPKPDAYASEYKKALENLATEVAPTPETAPEPLAETQISPEQKAVLAEALGVMAEQISVCEAVNKETYIDLASKLQQLIAEVDLISDPDDRRPFRERIFEMEAALDGGRYLVGDTASERQYEAAKATTILDQLTADYSDGEITLDNLRSRADSQIQEMQTSQVRKNIDLQAIVEVYMQNLGRMTPLAPRMLGQEIDHQLSASRGIAGALADSSYQFNTRSNDALTMSRKVTQEL